MPTTEEIRSELLIMYSDMWSIANNILTKNKERDPGTSLTVENILDKFIAKSLRLHKPSDWDDSFNDAVILLSCHFISEAQGKAINSGVLVKSITGSSADGAQIEYLRPSMSKFGKYATTTYGRQWEALKEIVKENKEDSIDEIGFITGCDYD